MPRFAAFALSGALFCALAGCSGQQAKVWPALVPMQTLLDDPAPVSPDPAPDLAAQGAAVRAAGDALRRETP